MNSSDRAPSASASGPASPVDHPSFPVVGIGASAGGFAALLTLLENMPPAPGMTLVVVMHFSPDEPSSADKLLQSATGLPVLQVTHRTLILPDHIFIIPPGHSLKMEDGHLVIEPVERLLGGPIMIDIFFRTLAEAHKEQAIGVVLSGMGGDGVAGLANIREHGGVAIVQLPAEAGESSMPQSAIESGMADFVLPAAQIPAKLIELRDIAQTIRRKGLHADMPAGAPPMDMGPDPQDTLYAIFSLLRTRTGHDFRQYKQPTLLRRLERRLQVRGVVDLPSYHQLLQKDHNEPNALLKDLLIGVTSFFRDPHAFLAFENQVIPHLLHGKRTRDEIRAWVVACSTGEEAYSIGMLLSDGAVSLSEQPEIQVFASDIDERAIQTARSGKYAASITADVATDRLQRHFILEGQGYRVRKSLRDQVLFAQHNVLHDPAFSRLDLITCRNFLIYLNREMHRQLLERFHFALKPGGYLFLGSAESADVASDLFAPVDARYRIYQARTASRMDYRTPVIPTSIPVPPIAPLMPVMAPIARQGAAKSRGRMFSFADIHQHKAIELSPSILIDSNMNVLHIAERAGRYLHHAGGEPTRDILDLVMPELRPALRTALYEAQKSHEPVSMPPIRLDRDGNARVVLIVVASFEDEHAEEPLRLIYFTETTETAPLQAADNGWPHDAPLRQLEEELHFTRGRLRETTNQAEIIRDELSAANEELQSTIEELRAGAEEHVTSREELQSINEELKTVNDQLKMRADETAKAHDDLSNLIASTDIATLFLDREMRIKRYTPRITDIFNVIATDIGRPLMHLASKLDYPNLTDEAFQVFATLQPLEREVRSKDGRFYIVRVHPYRTTEDRIDGAVMTFFDISSRRAAEQALRDSEELFRLFVTTSSDTLYKMSADWTEMRSLQGMNFLADTKTESATWLEKYIPEEDRLEVKAAIEGAVRKKSTFELEHRVIRADGTIGWTLSRAVPMLDTQNNIAEWFGSASDITQRRLGENALRESEARFRALAEASPALIWQIDANGNAVYLNQRYLDMTGLEPGQLLAAGWHVIIHPDDARDYLAALDRSLQEQSLFQKRVRLRMADGSWHWFESHALPWYAANQNYRGHVGSSIDVDASA